MSFAQFAPSFIFSAISSPASVNGATLPTKTGPAQRSLPGRILSAFTEWQGRATERNRLSGLDDRLLGDMGITRADAYHESRKRFWQA